MLSLTWWLMMFYVYVYIIESLFGFAYVWFKLECIMNKQDQQKLRLQGITLAVKMEQTNLDEECTCLLIMLMVFVIGRYYSAFFGRHLFYYVLNQLSGWCDIARLCTVSNLNTNKNYSSNIIASPLKQIKV